MSFSLANNNKNTRLPPMNARFLDSSDEESEDEETRLEREEQEQERLLSKQFGEAQESNLGTKRKKEDEDIEAEYSSNTKPKKKRLVLTPAHLTSAQGLIRLSSEFPRTLCWKQTSGKNKTQAAAVYSKTLVTAYKSFCYDLFPSMAFSDVLTRVETFGSKKEVKDYLQLMRQNSCQTHLERIYGKESALRMMEELQHGLEQQGMDEFGAGHAFPPEPAGGGVYEGLQRGPALNDGSGDKPAGNDGALSQEDPAVSATNTGTGNGAARTSADENTTDPARPTETTTTTTTITNTTTEDLQDSDDELEFVVSTKPAPINPFADDDDDSDDEEPDTKMAKNKETPDVSTKTNLDTKDQEAEEDDIDIVDVVSKTGANAALQDEEDEDDATVVMAGLQTNSNQATRPEESSDFQSRNELPTVKDTTTDTTTLHDTQETINDDVMGEEGPQDDDDKVNVLPQETQQDSPLSSSSSSNETATIVPTMSESQLDMVATQANDATQDSLFVATEEANATDSTLEETPTQLESPGEEKEEATRMES